jgi:hypothetical protein
MGRLNVDTLELLVQVKMLLVLVSYLLANQQLLVNQVVEFGLLEEQLI